AIHHTFDLVNLYRFHANNEIAYYNLLFSVAISAAAFTIVELGTGPGISSLAFIRVLQYYNSLRAEKGTLHTCDLNPAMQKPLKHYGEIVKTHLMSTNKLAGSWTEHKTSIDLLHIDADHSHEQSLKDFDIFSPFVQTNSLILMHDTFPLSGEYERPHLSGTVYKTAQHIKEEYREEFEIMTIPYLCGISIVRKKGAKYF
ncbi:MAG: class I SAM-dependent methyltransferase, partial [Deltaproteobacteria bacterium]|nr:class I SAM-dependent methyltransferase [Deltaproteobacteria bacterium]